MICWAQKDTSWKFDSFYWDAFNSLKKAFISAPILTYWIPDIQLIMETDALNYALATILSIVNGKNKIHLVAFHSYTFTMVELNYDIYDKKLLAIFKAFKIWWYYLEGPVYPINVVMDHKNLEYFSTTKVLTQRQVWWSEYLFQFNLVIRFCSSHLGTKLDTFTRWWNVYSKGGEYWLYYSQLLQLQTHLYSRITCGLHTSYCSLFLFSLHSYSYGSRHPTSRYSFGSF